MLETAASDRTNQILAAVVSVAIAAIFAGLGIVVATPWWIGVTLAGLVYWLFRRRVFRRRQILKRPFSETYRAILNTEVSFYRALDDAAKNRFENMAKVFLDEVAITGINETVDDQTRILVAASAIIPIFGFDDFEYSGLGEVLIYPNSFNHDFDSVAAPDRNILGMVGSNHLSGVMILSKPSLIAGFAIDNDKNNVGIHEFAHLVDKQAGGIDGVPPTAPANVVDPWVQWVGRELKRDETFADINDYAYTNEAEYFAVLTEYFFENPTQLQAKHPKLYAMMRQMYHQDTKKLLSNKKRKRRRVRRNDPCPCGSGEKYKRCCRTKRMKSA